MLEVGAFAEREKDLADVVLQVIVNSYMEKVQKWKGSEKMKKEDRIITESVEKDASNDFIDILATMIAEAMYYDAQNRATEEKPA